MPAVVVMCTCPHLGRFIVLPTTVVVVSLVDTGPPRTSPVGSESEWPGECHRSRSVSSECRWSTRMGVRGHGFCGVGTVRYLCRVFIKSIDSNTVRSRSHYQVLVEMEDKPEIIK